jgi:signal transduction histidine kinase/integral membrane sensor domain MASE1
MLWISSDRSKIVLVTLIYLGVGWLGYLCLNLGSRPSPIWISAGIGLTAVFLGGKRLVLAVFLGDLLLTLFLGASWPIALFSAIGSSLSAFLGAQFLHYFRFSANLQRIRDIMLLVFLAALLASAVNASIDTFARSWLNTWDWRQFGQYWGIIWLGDSTGILMTTPLLLRFFYNRHSLREPREPQRILEALLCMSLLTAVTSVVLGYQQDFLKPHWSMVQYLEYLPFPFVVWAAMRFQTWGAVVANFLVSALALMGLARGISPFILQAPDYTRAVLVLQMFLAIVMSTSLFLSAAITERQQIDRALNDTLEREHLLTQVALKVHQSLDIEQVLNTIVEEIRHFLDADQVYIGHCQEGGWAKVIAESRCPEIPSLMGWFPEPELLEELGQLFSLDKLIIADNTAKVQTLPTLKGYYEYLHVKSSLVLPLTVNNQHLGALVVHQYSQPRHWQKSEVKLLEQLATQVCIAIGQAQLYQRVQSLNNNLEQEVEERTLELREKVREIQHLYEMKTVFLQAVSHDLRTSIMGLVMLLKNLQCRQEEKVAISRSMLDQVVRSCDRQLTLINALSENHFAEERPLILHRQPLALKEQVEIWLREWQKDFDLYQATFINLLPDDLPAIDVDPCQLRGVFEQLLNNALKHNPPPIQLALDARIDRDMLYCTLSDNGIGMDEDQCQHLFRLYVRNLHNQHLTGIGLGSYQCRQIIEAHGGRIGVKSTPNVGSQFWFTLPLAHQNSRVINQELVNSNQ